MKEIIIFNPSIEDGGVEKNLYIISNFLSKKGLKISLISTDIDKKKKFNKNINFINPGFMDYSKSGRYVKYLSCLLILIYKILINRNIVVLAFQANIYALIICKMMGIKVITRLNTAPQGWEHSSFKKLIYSYFIKKADLIIVNSIEFKKEVDKRYKMKSLCILNPFDFKKIKRLSEIKVKNFFRKNSLKIVNVARLTDQKEQLVILKALKKILKFRKAQVVIVGKGKKINELNSYIDEHKLHKFVKLVGYKSNPFPYILHSDVFVLSSKYEGSPNVLTECQYLKRFIISTDCPTGTKEILGNGKYGYLFKVGDYQKLARILRDFKITSAHKKMINLAHNETKKHNYELICDQYYKSIKSFV